ncbi:MAG: hydroxylamine reductase [Candidatus Omnitrophota bacterium]
MFCYQCEQAFRGAGCQDKGVCGKEPEVAALQDVLLHEAKGIAYLAHEAKKLGKTDAAVNRFTLEALFVTVTNVNFDSEAIIRWIREASKVKVKAKALYAEALQGKALDGSAFPASVKFVPAAEKNLLFSQAVAVTVLNDNTNADLRSLIHLLVYGIKGMAAYAHHAMVLGYEDETVYAFIHEALAAIQKPGVTMEELFELNMRCGQVNLKCMEILDRAHHETFGHPEPTKVSKTLRKGPAIIVSGHDMHDLHEILKQSEGTGISVYTHGEMLPAHGYPGLRKYAHLAGHYGTAWQNQAKEFDRLPAAIYFTTNCIQEPKTSYQGQVFTGGTVGWPGVQHIQGRDFSPLIQKALALGGFKKEIPGGTLMTGFAHHAVLGVAGKIVEAVKTGAIRHFFLIGGCDGAKPGRNYYTDFAQQTPKDSVILTLACGKFRFNGLDFGTVAGLPRLLDIGQCNDAYSAIKIAGALAEAFRCGVNDLPLSMILSWYEQKAVVILLTLLSLGIKGIRLGPSLPAFITPNVLKVLVEKFDIRPIQTPEKDLDEILGTKKA